MSQILLAIESSCDETAAAVVTEDLRILSNVVASQEALHVRFGGVVPEIASRAHVERILPVIDEALKKARVEPQELSLIAVVTQPGLVGSLLVGVTAAKTLSVVWDLPLIGVHHLEGHLYACRMAAGKEVVPSIGLVVSGGHSNLYDCKDYLDLELIGATTDDAAGEAFDKVASMLGLPYPGGPNLERLARTGDPLRFRFPRAFWNEDRLEFSFSGLKTAVLYQINGQPPVRRDPQTVTDQERADIAASFQAAVVDVLVRKSELALRQRNRRRLCIGGGVAANLVFRTAMEAMANRVGVELIIPPMSLCTDNAAMGAVAWEHFRRGNRMDLSDDVRAGLIR